MSPSERSVDGANGGHSPLEIEVWLQTRIALLLSVEPRDIDPMQPLAALGLDSVMAVCLVGELELFLDIPVPEQLISPRASIHELARQLIAECRSEGADS
ncbi:MAG: Phosphopantetheine attachment site [Pseudomonadota bacterium]